jgi:hypothetical protein
MRSWSQGLGRIGECAGISVFIKTCSQKDVGIYAGLLHTSDGYLFMDRIVVLSFGVFL